jgi:hypothetical protein
MARKFEIKPGTNRFAWNPDRCEEILIIGAFQDIEKFIPPHLQWGWRKEFEDLFFERGSAVSFHLCDLINAERKRKNLKLLELRETDVSEWAREHNKGLRAERRRELRDWLVGLSPDDRAQTLIHAEAETRELPPPHRTFDEWKASRDADDRASEASRIEVSKRLAAQTEPLPPPPILRPALSPKELEPPMTADTERVARLVKMLSLASDPELIRAITAQLPPMDQTLDLAEEIDDPKVRDVLVRHCLASMGETAVPNGEAH